MEEITVTVGVQGDVQVAVKGVQGASCKDLTKNIEAALGEVESIQKTKEYNEREQPRNLNRGRQ